MNSIKIYKYNTLDDAEEARNQVNTYFYSSGRITTDFCDINQGDGFYYIPYYEALELVLGGTSETIED